MKIGICQVNPTVGAINKNKHLVLDNYNKSVSMGAELVVFPELILSGYPPQDLLLRKRFLAEAADALDEIAKHSSVPIILGNTFVENNELFNCSFLCEKGKIVGFYKKILLPTYDVIDEDRYFKSGDRPRIFELNISGQVKRVGLQVCEDLWDHNYSKDLAESIKITGADIIINISASPYGEDRLIERSNLIKEKVQKTGLPFVYCNLVGSQDELIFDGSSFALNHDGKKFYNSSEFKEETAQISFQKTNGKWAGQGNLNNSSSSTERLYKALVLGLRDYVNNNKFPGVVLGLSGGVDSALVAAVATDAFGPDLVQAIMLPSPFTGNESLNDAKEAAELLKIKYSNLKISEAMKIVESILGDFKGPKFEPGITEENIQSRLRGLLLMALSNRYGYMVLATGNKSEYAVGYSTLYGDMCGGYAPIKDVWKTDVFKLCNWRNENYSDLFKGPKGKVIPENIINKAPTAELRDNQKDTDSLPEYNILDEILKGLVEDEISVEKIVSKGFDRKVVEKTAQLLARSEYKRFQAAPGPKVTNKAFGRDRRFPLTSGFNNWS